MKLKRAIALVCLATVIPVLAQAQWQWIDKDGRKVFSDQAPPPDVPADKILKQPAIRARAVTEAEAAAAAAVAASAPSVAPRAPAASAPLSAKDRELLDRKRQADAAEADKKKAEEERVNRLRQENCGRVRQAKAAMDSGRRITRTNEKGEVEFLDDAAKAAEARRLQGILDTDCK